MFFIGMVICLIAFTAGNMMLNRGHQSAGHLLIGAGAVIAVFLFLAYVARNARRGRCGDMCLDFLVCEALSNMADCGMAGADCGGADCIGSGVDCGSCS